MPEKCCYAIDQLAYKSIAIRNFKSDIYILVDQEAENLPAVKAEVHKANLTADKFAALWAKSIYNISFGCSDQYVDMQGFLLSV